MRIPGEIPKINRVYGSQKNIGRIGGVGSVSSKRDVLSISNEAKDFQTVFKALKDIPDIRRGKVSELTEKYESGNYNVSGRDVADKVISSVFDKKA